MDSDESSVDDEDRFKAYLQRVKDNNPHLKIFQGFMMGLSSSLTNEGWEQIGKDVSNNTHLENINLNTGVLNKHLVSFFRGLTSSNTIKNVNLSNNVGIRAEGVRSMVPFLQNSKKCLRELDFSYNCISSEGFNVLFRALRDSPIEKLNCNRCGIESIEIDSNYIPQNLKSLTLIANNINADGCRELAKLLQGDDATLRSLELCSNKVDDDGVEILVDALQNNKSLKELRLSGNDGISNQGQILLLKLLNDISSIKATLLSNHTLECLSLEILDEDEEIKTHIYMATEINSEHESNPDATGRKKVICTQMCSVKRTELAALQEIDHSVYSEIDPLHLPEVLSLVDQHHGLGELYVALK
eukprot:scaffold2079_cov142-Skeletonema_marinoi.AAC.2